MGSRQVCGSGGDKESVLLLGGQGDGVSATELARRFGMTQRAVSISVRRGENTAREKGLKLLG
jgi:hypothetical protein